MQTIIPMVNLSLSVFCEITWKIKLFYEEIKLNEKVPTLEQLELYGAADED